MSGGSGSPRGYGEGAPRKEAPDQRAVEPSLPRGEEDEPPGSYLAELGVGTANIAWGAVNLVLVLAVGTVAVTLGTSPGSPWRPLARLVWSLLPISSIILAIVTFWQRGNAYATPAPRKALGAIALAAASLALWLVLRFALDVLPPS